MKNSKKQKRFRKLDLEFNYLSFGMDVLGLWKRISFFIKDHSLFTVIKKNKQLVKKENNEKKLYVCALGPSLQDVDLTKIQGDTLVVNFFYRFGNRYPSFVPTYYLWIDDAAQRIPDKVNDALNLYYNRGTTFIFNSKISHASLLNDYNLEKIFFMSTFRGDFHPDKDYDLSKIMPVSGNVASFAILLGILMGYKEIYLLGCDFNSFTTPKPLHCYTDNAKSKSLTLAQDLLAYAHVAKYHENLQFLAERKGVKIYNATKGSLIDAYPFRIDENLYLK